MPFRPLIRIGRPLDRPWMPRIWDRSHCPPQTMYPGDLIKTLWEHRHGRIYSLGIEANRWGARMRADIGIAPHGTLFIVSKEHVEKIPDRFDSYNQLELKPAFSMQKSMLFSIPCDGLPYQDITVGAYFDENQKRMRGTPLARGWRSLLIHLCHTGILRPSEELSWLIGGNSYKAIPRRYWE